MTATQPQREAATRASFLVAGMGMGAWAPLVPYAKARLGASEGGLGLLLLGLGLGSILAMPVAGAVIARFGSRALIVLAALLTCVTLPLLAILPGWTGMVPAIVAFGIALGTMDVSINVHAVIVERASGRNLMSGFHGWFSVGGGVGAAGVAAALALGAPPWLAALIVVGVLLVLLARFGRALLPEGGERGGTKLAFPHGIVLLVGALCFASFLAEGAMLDWSAVALTTLQGLPEARGGLGYAVFSVVMTLGRFTGDRVVAALGSTRVLAVGGTVAAAGLLLAMWSPTAIGALCGYALVGLGASNIAPVLFSAAGRQTRMPTQLAVATVSTMGYAGVLAGPALIGLVAHASSLPVAFCGVAALMLAIAVFGRAAARA